jgi:diaminohydroxyphosphoribosylaminopyrimidine deaminase / 5-amino-6-(5-phosphoribosylamino)uracil reductase
VITLRPGDRAHLARSIALAARVAGSTSPNPPVGCVIVRDGAVVAEGATAPAGGPHAEAAALAKLGSGAKGATAYVTLEPCAHHGRTPPCSDALVRAGISRVVYVHPDPNAVAAGGASAMREAGLTVDGPLDPGDDYRGMVGRQLEGFLSLVTRHRPHVTLKLAQTADGRLEAPEGVRWVTGAAARTAVHRWRAAADAVLVGSGTVLADDPSLDVRHIATTRQPRPVVFDARLRTPLSARVVRPGALFVTTPDAPGRARASLLSAGVELVDVLPADGGGVRLVPAMAALGRHGIATLFAEPGARLASALVAADLVDRLVLHVAVGVGEGSSARGVPSPSSGPWRTERRGGAGPDLILHLVPSAERLAIRPDDEEAA